MSKPPHTHRKMITRKVIQTLYKKYRKRPESPDCLDIPLLFDVASENHNISIDMDGPADSLVIGSISPESPFHRIALEKIHAIVPFEEWVAIVLHSSIIFLSKKTSEVSVNVQLEQSSIFDRLSGFFSK